MRSDYYDPGQYAVAPPEERSVRKRGTMDLPYLILTVLLVVLGLIMLFSASFARAYSESGNSAYYFVRQAFFAVGGGVVIFLITRFDYRIWRVLAFPILVASLLLLVAILIPGIGESSGGATRWISIGPIRFQPSEIAKLGVVLSFATLISSYREKMRTFKYGVLPFVAILGIIIVLLFQEPHLSAIIIICAIGASMMFLGGTRIHWFVLLAVAAVVFLAIYLKAQDYAGSRITAWRDPFSDPTDKGYQVLQSLYAIGSGGFMGLGLGKSRQKYMYLPEEHNDYIFSIVCEELGFVGATLVIILFVLLIVRGYWLSMHARDRFGALVIAGLTTQLALQVFFNIGVVSNFLPSTGISLPFFSYGGTALIIQMAEQGIVLAISRYNLNKI